MDNLNNFTFKIIPNFLTNEEVKLIKDYCIFGHKNNKQSFDTVQNDNGDTYFYKDPLMQSLLINKKHIMEKTVGIDLNETYSFWRCYTWGAELKEHRDRPSCEISATVFIDSDGTDWPIYMGDTPINLKIGDAVAYRGCDLKHKRDEFKGDYHIQAFLHYVDKNGKYAEHKGDQLHENIAR